MDRGNNDDASSKLVTLHDCKLKDHEERLKKSEWSDGAIHELLNAYEAKWNDRNRGNFRVGDWEDVSALVSIPAGGMQTMKTPIQCKNKIEGMKKKYRSEAESCSNKSRNCSEWPFFSRMDLMLRCPTLKAGIPGGMDAGYHAVVHEEAQDSASGDASEAKNVELFAKQSPIESLGHTLHIIQQQLEREHNVLIRQPNFAIEQDGKAGDGGGFESDTSPALVTKNEKTDSNALEAGSSQVKCQKKIQSDMAMDIRSFAQLFLKLEQAKIEMYKDTERLHAEAETRRAELELERAQVIMDTQLQIARLISVKPRKRKASTVCQIPKQNDVFIDETCVSGVHVERQLDLQSASPGNEFILSEPSFRQE
ncbi:hypothetical protein SUGI_0608470 [Cryptomeria japonica]|nr:hypothetical protein SUGI_0608470 [Cryptomeria japonica]